MAGTDRSHEIAADIGPQLRRMQGKLDNFEGR